MEFNKQKYIASMQKPVDKLLGQLNKEGISFIPTDGVLENVIFTKGDKTIKMSHHSFYRYSGMVQLIKGVGDEKTAEMKAIPVTDEMWLQVWIKPIILTRLEHA